MAGWETGRQLAVGTTMRGATPLAAALAIATLSGCGPPAGHSGPPTAPLETAGVPTPSAALVAASPVTVSAALPSPTVPPDGALPAPPLVGTEWIRLPTSRTVVALTFDSGGDAGGAQSILSTLATAKAPATFFLTGRWVELFPDVAREIAAAHAIGNHTYGHARLPPLTDEDVQGEIERGEAMIWSVTGQDPRPPFRFPFGDRDARTIAAINRGRYGSIRWTIDTLGWMGRSRGESVDSIVARVVERLEPGAIILMHVGATPADRSTLDADALPRVIAAIRARGYEIVALRDFL